MEIENNVTISTHNGSQVARQHNLRNPKVICKEDHIDPNGHFEVWLDEDPKAAYERLFGEAVKAYNEKQTRPAAFAARRLLPGTVGISCPMNVSHGARRMRIFRLRGCRINFVVLPVLFSVKKDRKPFWI